MVAHCRYTPTQIPLPPPQQNQTATTTKFIKSNPHLTMLDRNCKNMRDVKQIHAHIIKTGLYKDHIAASRLLAFCASKEGDVNYAYSVFTRIKNPNMFAWNTIIRGFSRSSNPSKAVALFVDMLHLKCSCSDFALMRLTYPCVFNAFAQLGFANRGGWQLQGRVIKLGLEHDGYIQNSILYMYASFGFLSEARRLFDRGIRLDLVSCNTMIMGLAKCGELDEARRLFDGLKLSRNVISWNSMISGYVRKGKFNEALQLFKQMQEEGVSPSEFTMVSLLNTSSGLGAIRLGEWLHDYMLKNRFEMNSIVVTAIIDMYSRCGCVDKALQVFNSTPNKALSSWNSMILGLAFNGCENEAMQLFSILEESSRYVPDHVSFIAVLTACSHSGLVDKAKEYFFLMTDKYKIEPSLNHYSCMVDVLGRAGLIEEADDVIKGMPVNPDPIIWTSLLSSCKKFGNTDLARRATKHVMELDPSESSSACVVMSNVYASSSNYKEAVQQRLSLKEKDPPGSSLIEVNGEVHEFVSSGNLHRNAKEIYGLLTDSLV